MEPLKRVMIILELQTADLKGARALHIRGAAHGRKRTLEELS